MRRNTMRGLTMGVRRGLAGAAVALGAAVAVPGTALAATPTVPAGSPAAVPAVTPAAVPAARQAAVPAARQAAVPVSPADGCRPWLHARARYADDHGHPGVADVLHHRAERRAAWAGCV
jgi:hypothetical protein